MKHHFLENLRVMDLLVHYQPRNGVELGVFKGENTQQLVYCLPRLVSVSDGLRPFMIVPPSCHWSFVQGVSYAVLTGLDEEVDFASIDTDHNGWTLDKELTQLERLMKPGSLLVLHDTEAFKNVDGTMLGYGEHSSYPLAEIHKFPVPYGQVIRQRPGWKIIKEVTKSAGAMALERVS